MSVSEKMGAGSQRLSQRPRVTQRNSFANAPGLIKISYSWRVLLILEIVVSALSGPFLIHLLWNQDRERWMARKQTPRPVIKVHFLPSAKEKQIPDTKSDNDTQRQTWQGFSRIKTLCLFCQLKFSCKYILPFLICYPKVHEATLWLHGKRRNWGKFSSSFSSTLKHNFLSKEPLRDKRDMGQTCEEKIIYFQSA